MDNKKILIIEDDKSIRTFTVISLVNEDYDCVQASNGEDGICKFKVENPDLILLDLGLPDIDGNEVLKQIRQISQIPIIIVSARGKDDEKVAALDMGADDYLTKPFSLNELLAHIRAVLRRNEKLYIKQPQNININNLQIDLDKHLISVENRNIHLTPIEYNLIVLLAKNVGKVLTYRQIIKEIWGGTFIEDDMHTLRVNMANIRRKIEKDSARPKYIVTEVGIGYRFLDNLN